MANMYTHFPRELDRNIIQELDRRFWIIFIVTMLVNVTFTYYMKSVPYVPSIEMQQKVLKRLYKAQAVTTQIKVADIEQLRERRAAQEEQAKVEKVEEKRAERAKITGEQRTQARAAKRGARVAQTESLRKAVSQMTVFSAAGARQGGRGYGRAGRGTGTGGGGSGKFAGIAGDSRGIAGGGVTSLGGSGGRKLITGGAIKEEAGGIEIAEGGAAGIVGGELGGGLEMEAVEEIKGEGAKNVLRSAETLNAILQQKAPSVQRCFERYKKRDPQLNGRVLITMTILPDGSVTRISLKSQWSNPALGAEVDDCIRSRVENWRFDRIEKGEAKIEVPMSFY